MYKQHIHKYANTWVGGNRERGGLTVFTAVMVLILMTLMLVYATRISVFETRVSSNEVRQKEAFHVAEAALDQGIMYLLSNAGLILSSRLDEFPDGTNFTRDGWFGTGSSKWVACPSTPSLTNPCGGGVEAVAGSFYYDTDGSTSTFESLPITEQDFPTGTTARLSALICFIDINDPTAACGTAPANSTEENEATMALTLLAYGYSDCTDTTVIATCNGEATIALPVSNFKKLGGSPNVPLTTKSTFPPTGTGEIVANPNAGGVGVPLSAWVNDNAACHPGTDIESSGSWQTCELQEWYHTESRPEGTTCTDNNCLCGPGGNDTEYFLSWKKGTDTNIGIDIIVDDTFPCDLFEYYFKVPRNLYATTIKAQARVMSDCTGLGPQSSGLIWISGSECRLTANTVVGSPNFPVILVSAATNTVLAGGVEIYGVLYIFDGEDINADLATLGGATVYGAVIVDAVIDKFQGTFQIVYSDAVLANASGIGGLGSVNGGWRDFGLPEIAW